MHILIRNFITSYYHFENTVVFYFPGADLANNLCSAFRLLKAHLWTNRFKPNFIKKCKVYRFKKMNGEIEVKIYANRNGEIDLRFSSIDWGSYENPNCKYKNIFFTFPSLSITKFLGLILWVLVSSLMFSYYIRLKLFTKS